MHAVRLHGPLLAATAILSIGLLACSCAPPSTSDELEGAAPAARVYVLGIDGAGWNLLDPALEAGTMPHLARLIERGSRGQLHSMEPTASAIVWTTLATGKRPDKHGILGFTTVSPRGKTVPVSSNLRRARAIWNIASDAGLRVGFLGWWVTWPAETVNGFMASDYTWPLRKSDRGFAIGVDRELAVPGRTHPPHLLEELEPFIVTGDRLRPGQLEQLRLAQLPPTGAYAVREMILKDVSLGAMTPFLLERYHPALFAVYFDGFDAYAHHFWPDYDHFATARAAGPQTLARLPETLRAIGETMQAHLTRIDGYLGALVDHARPEDVVLVISDHGYDHHRDGSPVMRGYDEWIEVPHWHTLDGILVAAGGPIRSGAAIDEAGVLDIAPTILALLGLPVAEDMDGRVLSELIDPQFMREHPLRTIETYETGDPTDDAPLESGYDEEVLERLRSLGYVD